MTFENELIKSVRFFWDQGSMLKQLNIIGTRGNIWPIFSGADQEKLMVAEGMYLYKAYFRKDLINVTASSSTNPAQLAASETNYGPRKHFDIADLEPEQTIPVPRPGVIAAAASAKPKPRNLQDLMDETATAPASPQRMGSAPKSYDMFDEQNQAPLAARQMKGPAPVAQTPEQIRAKRNFNSKNFEPHFKFGTPDTKPSPYSKTRANMHPQPDELKWDYDSKTGTRQQVPLGNGRRDMSNSFEIRDESSVPEDRFGGIKIAGNGMGSNSAKSQLNIFGVADEDEVSSKPQPRHLVSTLDFADSREEEAFQQTSGTKQGGIKIAGNGMGSNSAKSQLNIFGMANEEESAETQSKPLVEQVHNVSNTMRETVTIPDKDDLNGRFQGIKIAGNGMGSRGQHQWGWDVEAEAEVAQKPAQQTRYQPRMTSHRQFTASWGFGEDEKENN